MATASQYYSLSLDGYRLIPAPLVLTTLIDGQPVKVANPKPELLEQNGYHLLAADPAPTPPEGKEAVFAGYALDETDGKWHRQYTYRDVPLPTLEEYDAAMEAHLREEREERGYTTREPDTYLTSEVPRWAQDARDWVAHRDAVMEYALALINGVQSGTVAQPTMAEFKAGLPVISWTYAEEGGEASE